MNAAVLVVVVVVVEVVLVILILAETEPDGASVEELRLYDHSSLG